MPHGDSTHLQKVAFEKKIGQGQNVQREWPWSLTYLDKTFKRQLYSLTVS